MKYYDWKKNGVEHLERGGCIINIREGLTNLAGKKVISIEIIPDSGWSSDGYPPTIRVTEEVKLGR